MSHEQLRKYPVQAHLSDADELPVGEQSRHMMECVAALLIIAAAPVQRRRVTAKMATKLLKLGLIRPAGEGDHGKVPDAYRVRYGEDGNERFMLTKSGKAFARICGALRPTPSGMVLDLGRISVAGLEVLAVSLDYEFSRPRGRDL